MKARVHTLTGYTENPAIAIDILLGNYFKALKSASTLVPNEVRSFIYDVQSARSKHGITEKITNSVKFLFEPHFDAYEVDTKVVDGDDGYAITLKVVVKDNGDTIDVAKLVNATDTKIALITDISNKGTR